MGRRATGAVHVAKIERKHGERVYTYWLLRQTYREGGKVRHRTLGNISHLPAETIEAVRCSLAGEACVPIGRIRVVGSRPHGHVAAVWTAARALGFPELLGPASRMRDLAFALLVARVVRPGSKLATSRWWARTTLGQDLGVEGASSDEVYAAMDWLLSRQGEIEGALAASHLTRGGLVLHDVTSVHVEGRCCPLAAHGHSRDGHPELPQIVFGLSTDAEGRPVAVEVYPGNTADPATVEGTVTKLKDRFGLDSVVMVGDRGMITKARIDDLRRVGGVGWITSLRAPSIRVLADAGALQMSLFDESDLAEIVHPDYPGERLVACRNPALAITRARKREELVSATEARLARVRASVARASRPLRGADRIGIAVGKVLDRFRVGKHFHIEITDDDFRFSRNEKRIATEAALDGVYVIRTSVGAGEMDAAGVVLAYKSLSRVEADFRSLKTTHLEVGPVRHHREDRVRSHVLICMLACYVAWHMRRALAPLTFTDEEPPAREDPVAPAVRSAGALAKASRRTTGENAPALGFTDLLDELACLVRDEIGVGDGPGAVTFERVSEPSLTARRAFELLGAPVPAKLL
ncbi:MAG: IS1634 family transposase [Actinomycetota bacterium]|nr:IS1634 family transposase [Actinomycetota bacterium]